MSETLDQGVGTEQRGAGSSDAASTHGDDLDAVLSRAYDESLKQAEDDPGTQRDARGRFVGAAQDTGDAGDETDKPDDTGGKQAEPAIDAPVSWSAEEKAQWSNLSPEVRATIARRERDVDTALRERAAELNEYKPIKTVLDEHRERFERHGLTSAGAVAKLLTAQKALESNLVGTLPDLIRAFGHDPHAVAQAILGNSQAQTGAAQNHSEQNYQRLQEQVEYLLNKQTADSVEAIRQNPAYPFFEEVRHEMGAILKVHPDWPVERLYNAAVRLNDEVFAKAQAATTEKAEQARAKAALEAAEKRRRAASSVRDSPNGAAPGRTQMNGLSLEQQLEAAWAAHSA
jgi:hypothetical protein